MTSSGVPLSKLESPPLKNHLVLSDQTAKRPDGVTQIPWQLGKCVAWDVTVTDTLAASNLSLSASTAGSAAERAAEKKVAKYDGLASAYSFVPVAFETLGPINSAGCSFIDEIGRRARFKSGDTREANFLWQRLSVAVQRYNAICLLGTFEAHQDG